MTPYYEQDGITIYHGDCREVLPEVVADAVVTDPPYGVGLVAKRRPRPGYSPPSSQTIYEDDPDAVRVLLARAIPVALSRCKRGLIFTGVRMMDAYPIPTDVGCVFTKTGSVTRWGFQTLNPIFYYGTDPYLANGLGSRPNGILGLSSYERGIDHPCPKPIKWMRWAVERASTPGETVLDPFMGSGTTLRAAKDLGREAIGIEIEERYCEIAAKRLGQGAFDFGTVA